MYVCVCVCVYVCVYISLAKYDADMAAELEILVDIFTI